ncbi:MAG: putative Ig domain-containing protein [Actinomycetota bacterium]
MTTAAVALMAAATAWAAPALAQGDSDVPVLIETLSQEPEDGAGVIGFRQSAVSSQTWRVRGFAQIDDVMYVSGSFQQVRESPNGGAVHDQAYLAAFDVDTGAWISTFRPVLDDVVWDIAATDDGRLVVGGEFDTVNGEARTGIVMLDTDGNIDNSFVTSVTNVGSTYEPSVRSVEVDGGTVYLAGDFNRIVDDQYAHGAYRVGRVNLSNGRMQQSWRPRVSGGGIFDLEIDPSNGVVHIVGSFTSVQAVSGTAAAAAVDINTASVMPWSQFAFNEMGGNLQYGAALLGDDVWVGGSQHFLQRLDADTYERQSFYVTSGQPGTIDPVIGNYESTGTGGDYQFVVTVDDQIIAGCHCHSGHHTSTTDDNINVLNRPVHAYNAAGERIDWFASLYTWNEGPYGAGGDTNGCLWVGGDFTGNVDGFARFCPFSETTSVISRPFSSVIGDDQAVEFRARVSDPTATTSIELRVINSDGNYLRPNGQFNANSNPLPATTSGTGTRVLRASYQLPVLPAGDYTLEVVGTGASGTDTEQIGLRVADLPDLTIGTGQPSNAGRDVFDSNSGKWVRGQINDPAMFGPQGYVPVNTATLLDHETDLEASDLIGVDIMWMPPATSGQYTAAELDVLEQWVANGGVMVAYSELATTDVVLERFGLPVIGDADTSLMTAVSANSGHPILNGLYGPVSQVGYNGRRFDPADVPGNWLTFFRNHENAPMVVGGAYGDGYVVALATRSPLQAQTGVQFLGNLMAHVTDVALELDDVTSIPPTVESVAPQTSAAFVPASLQIIASDPDGGSVGFSATGLPAGLSINASTGLISGTPTTLVVDAAVVVTVQDDEGDTAQAAFTWTVEEAALVPPANVELTTNGVDNVTIEWDAVGVASGYLIHRDFVFAKWVAAGTTTWTDTSVIEGGTYRYQVRSQIRNGDYSDPSPIEMITVGDEGPELPPFGTPPNPTIETNGVDTVTLGWDQVADATGYLVHRDYQFLKWVPFSESSWVDTSVVAGESYRYQIRAQRAGGEYSAPTEELRITVGNDGGPDTTPPQTPPNPAAVLDGDQVVVTWDPATDDRGVTGYLIHRNWQYYGFVAGDITTFIDDDLEPGGRYRYQIRAQDAAGNNSAPTTRVVVDVP